VAADVGHRCVGDRFCPNAIVVWLRQWVTAVWVTASVLKAAVSAKSRPWCCYAIDVWVTAAAGVVLLLCVREYIATC
jgi:hypothetical protein